VISGLTEFLLAVFREILRILRRICFDNFRASLKRSQEGKREGKRVTITDLGGEGEEPRNMTQR
jgi:hypothetical protein